MSEPQFARVSGTELYWLNSSGRTIAFQATPGTSIGDSPTLSQTWSGDAGGVYVFLAEAPTASDQDFETSLLEYLQNEGWPSGQKFLWLENPNAPLVSWSGQTLNATQSGGTWTVSRRADFRFINYTLTVTSGSVITLATEAQNWGFAFANGSIPVATFFGPNTSYNAKDGTLLLPFAGTAIACWRLAITLSNGDDFEQLGVGIRYFYPYKALPAERNVYIKAINLPTIFQPQDPLNLDVSLDSLQPLTPGRTYFSLIPLNVTAPSFASMFATARGYGVHLTPLAASGSTPDARFVFNEQPRFVGGDQQVPKDFYLTLQGAFSITWDVDGASVDASGNSIYRLLCGMSGLEYLGMPSDASSKIEFIPGQNAYAPLLPSEESGDPLSALGTTAWAWASTTDANKPVRYYAQPENAPLYKAPPPQPGTSGDDIGSVFLDFLEVPALILAASDGARSFPLAPYHNLAATEIADAKKVEAAAIAPARKQAILDADLAAWMSPVNAPPLPTDTIGVTPQGLSVGVAVNGMDWTWTGIANESDSTSARPDLVFTKASGAFRQSLETNRLFMVLANAAVFMNDGSVQYQLTREGIAEIQAEGTVPPDILAQVNTYFEGQGYRVYENETDFDAALVAATPAAEPYKLVFQRKSGLLVPRIGDWSFQISPRNWDNPERTERRHAMVIYKFSVGRSLAELTDDLPSWTWPEVSAFVTGGSPADAQAELQNIFLKSRESFAQTSGSGKQSPYANFIHILDDPNWTGVIAFSCEVPLNQLPGPLQALAAGIDSKRFYAHHVGFNMTPYGANPGSLIFGRTSMFGLLDYQDTEDQYFESNIYYAFKVLQLTVGFRNSVMTDFSSKVELLINRLFGMPAILNPTEHGNNVILDGVYQRQIDSEGVEHGTYVFTMETQNTFGIDTAALRNVVLLSTQLVTTRPADPANPEQTVISQFQMGGNLYYYEPANIDLFSFGADDAEQSSGAVWLSSSALRFGNLVVQMEFTMADRTPVFSFLTETLSFDIRNSKSRAKGLYANFPLKLSGFVATPDPLLQNPPLPPSEATAQSPESLGFVSITAGVQQYRMLDPWYGLVFDVDLGTLGALAGSAGLVLRLLLGWSNGGTRDEPAVYVGVRLPGIKDAIGVELPLQGVITLAFRTIEMIVNNTEQPGRREYMLRFRNFAMKFLGLSFPPGYNDIYLFGNPGQSTPTKLGWYAAYSAEKDEKKKKQLSATARQVNARRLPASRLTRRDR